MKTLRTLAVLLLATATMAAPAQIDRHAVVSRNNPHVNRLDSLSSLSVGNGGFAFTVDATGLQTFPQRYAHGVPLGTMSDWGWHSFPNTEGYRAEEALQDYDFGHTHKLEGSADQRQGEPYSVENKNGQRAKDAAAYLRANPHRLHLGCVGLDIGEPDDVYDIDQTLDLWTGSVRSSFCYHGKRYHVQTVCHPERDLVAARIHTERIGDEQGRQQEERIVLRFPYPSGQHSDDACVWDSQANGNHLRHSTQPERADEHGVLLRRTIDDVDYYVDFSWQGHAAYTGTDDDMAKANLAQTVCFADDDFSFCCEFLPEKPEHSRERLSFDEVALASASHWGRYWGTGGMADFSHCTDPRARELERRVVLSQYLLAVNCAGDTPPQETGLTYNSWFGKFHLEMIWWHQAQFALWGHPELLEHTLDWYFRAEPKAHEIARRQGFKGVRWMKMTDPGAEEAPSKVGSFLIWQQPHLIHLAELLRRAESAQGADDGRIVRKYWPLVEPTADFMCSFADYEKARRRYILKGCIPAQETLRADQTVNPPFELSYWHWALQTAGAWAKRMEGQTRTDWRRVADGLAPLAMGADSIYLAAESAPYADNDLRTISDHPAVLGAWGILPLSPQVAPEAMRRTLHWIWNHWNWQKTWGWDYPMVAMSAARMGEAERAVNALLMPRPTNSYLSNGHNYQDQRLRLYLPGNGGLLTAVAMMCAGWDGSSKRNPGFPQDGRWDVRWEGLLPLP